MSNDNSYYVLAENDFQFLQTQMTHSYLFNGMYSIARKACLNYLKYIIINRLDSDNTIALEHRDKIFESPTIDNICWFIQVYITIDMDLDKIVNVFKDVNENKLGFQASSASMEKCWEAIRYCKELAELYGENKRVSESISIESKDNLTRSQFLQQLKERQSAMSG